jgi:aspartokinase
LNNGNGRILCGGLLRRDNLAMLEFLGLGGELGDACSILQRFGDDGIPLAYVSVVNGPDGQRNVMFCIDRVDLVTSRPLVEGVEADLSPREVLLREPVVKFTLYGPHFQEKHALAASLFAALCGRGVKCHGISMSVNSISFIVDESVSAAAVGCLRERFEWPE